MHPSSATVNAHISLLLQYMCSSQILAGHSGNFRHVMRGWGKPLLPKACRLLWLINFAVVGEIFRMRLAAAAEPSSIMIYLFCRHNMRSIYWHQKRLMDMFTLSLATTAARMFVFEPLSSSDIE
jgi:hypothetical protein